MADTKITALTALTAADPANDVIPIVDVSDTSMAASGTTKKISVNNILGASGTATLASATITGDLTVRTNKLAVTSTGVGCGVATPTAALDILGAFGTSTAAAVIRNNSAANNSNISQVQFFTVNSFNGSEQVASIHGTNPNAGANNGGALVFNTSLNGTSTTPAERYRIGNDGTATWSVAGTTAMTLNSTGLGIGRSPIAKLNVDKASQTPGGTTPNGAFVITDNVGSNLALEFGVNSASLPYIQSRNSTIATYYDLFINPNGGNIAVGTTSSGGSISNTSQILAGIFSTLIGTASSVVTATPTTIFAAPSESTLIVTAYVSGAAPSDYKVVAVVKVSGGVVAITSISAATSITITASGTNIQVTQTSGGSQNVGFNVLRLA